jgi:hypothetical protein
MAKFDEMKANASPEKLEKILAREKKFLENMKKREAFENMTDAEKKAYKANKKAEMKAKKEAAWAEKKANASPEQLEKMLEKEKKRAEMK